MGRIVLAAASAALIGLTGGADAAGDAALVVGNSDYANGPRAKSAKKDAGAVAEALEDAGYEVTLGVDLTRSDLRATLDRFAAAAKDADRVIIYYSGHAMRMQGRTFLAPVDFDPQGPVGVAMDGAPLAGLMALAAQAPGAAVLFIDGAQLDGFEPTDFAEPGVAAIAPPEGVLVVSAAAPGEAVRRSSWFSSDFSRAIVSEFLKPGAAAAEVAARLEAPMWSAGTVSDGFTLVDAPVPVSATPEISGSGDVAQQIELAFWRSTEAAGTQADYQAYLRRYPNGLFADIARNRLTDGAGAATPAPTPEPAPSTPAASPPRAPTQAEIAASKEASLGLSREGRRKIQADLTELGYDTYGVDGLFGRGTRGAIRQWQESENLTVTGYLEAAQVRLLRRASQDAIDEREAAAEEADRIDAEEARRREAADWARARRVNSVAAYQRYLKIWPEGANANEAKAILRRESQNADIAAWEEARRIDTPDAYSRYLDRFPRGARAAEARRRYDALKAEQDAQGGSASTGGPKVERAWRAAQAQNTEASYRKFRDRFPDSRYAAEAERRRNELIDEKRKANEASLRLNAKSWRSIERRLSILGFNPGRIDGRVNKTTRNAIVQYRRSRGLPVFAYVDKGLIDLLVSETSQSQLPAGGVLNQLLQKLAD